MLTFKEVLDETVEYYSNNPRAVKGNSCYYYDNGRMCAVGRCLVNPEMYAATKTKISSLFELKNININSFKEQYRNISKNQWADLQLLHDNCDFWADSRLTKSGLEFKKKLEEINGT